MSSFYGTKRNRAALSRTSRVGVVATVSLLTQFGTSKEGNAFCLKTPLSLLETPYPLSPFSPGGPQNKTRHLDPK